MNRSLPLVLVLCALSAAEDWTPPENRNAALAYWRAFSMMKDLPSDEATAEKIREVIAGEAEFDASLSIVVDENADALKGLHRGSRLPECNFGLDYEDGAAMLLPHLAKARALGKLNVLLARRSAAQRKRADAVEALLCGVRFSDHLWRDGTLICGLVAKAIFCMHVQALTQLVGEGKVDSAILARVDEAMRKFPPYVFDWGAVILSEEACFAREWDRILASPDPKRILEESGMLQGEFGSVEDLAAGKASKEEAEKFRKAWAMDPTDLADAEKVHACVRRARIEYHGLLADMGAAIRGSYAEAQAKIARIEGRVESIGPLSRMMLPALGRSNDIRAVAEAERAGLIALVAIVRHRAEKGAFPESFEGLEVPVDPFTGKPFEVAKTEAAIEVRSAGKDSDGKPLVFRLAR